MNTTTTTMNRATADSAVFHSINRLLNKVVTQVVLSLKALDRQLSDQPIRPRTAVADLFRLADSYESTQPSYAADLRAAATIASEKDASLS